MNPNLALPLIAASMLLAAPAIAAPKKNVDAEADIDYRHDFKPLKKKHGTRVLIDRHHQTIYAEEGAATGADVMLEIMGRDGFTPVYADSALTPEALGDADILIIHGLPNDKIDLPGGGVFWKSPLTDGEIDAIIRFVDQGGGLFLSLSHFPGGSGAAPLLEAFAVKFRDGYAYSKEYPSFNDPENGRCSHYFGMSAKDGTLNADHPMLGGGPKVEKVDYLCGAAVFRNPEDAVLPFPPQTENHTDGVASAEDGHETSDLYAGMIAFDFGKGKVAIAGDQGMFRDFIFTFDTGERVYVTITSPDNDNANLFIDMMRWLSPKID